MAILYNLMLRRNYSFKGLNMEKELTRKYYDEEITTENQQKNVKRAAEIYTEYGNYIYSIIRGNVNSDWEAEDVYQDFFLSLVHRPVPDNIDNIKSYLYRAVMNDIFDAIRRTQSYKTRIYRHSQFKQFKAENRSPLKTMIAREKMGEIYNLIKEYLPEHEGQAVIQRYYYDKNTQEAAEELGVTKRSLSRYLCTGVKKLKKLMA